jgi:hypothetical protein
MESDGTWFNAPASDSSTREIPLGLEPLVADASAGKDLPLEDL